MILPEPIAKLRDEEGKKLNGKIRNAFGDEYLAASEGFEIGANWGFEQGALHMIELLRNINPQDEKVWDGELVFDFYESKGAADWLESQLDKMKEME